MTKKMNAFCFEISSYFNILKDFLTIYLYKKL